MPNKSNSATKCGIGQIRIVKGAKAKTYMADLRGNVLPKGVKPRPTFKTKKEAEDYCNFWTEQLKEHGKSAESYWSGFSDKERIRTGQLMEQFQERHPDITLDEVVHLGIRQKLEELESTSFPTVGEYITATYLPWFIRNISPSLGKDGKRRQKNEVTKALQPLLDDKEIKDCKLNASFNPKFRLRTKILKGLNSLTVQKQSNKKGKPVATSSLHKYAGYIHRMFKAAKLEFPDIIYQVPTEGLQGEFKVKGWKPSTTVSMENLKALFDAALNPPKRMRKWTHQIPYMALYFFSGCRPQEITGSHGDAHRVWYWERMNDWSYRCEKSGGLILTVDPIDEATGLSTSKTKYTTHRVLFPSGIAWLEWWLSEYGEDKHPTEGTYEGSESVFKNIRAHCGLAGEDSDGNNIWHDNGRHTLCSCAHLWKPSEKTYWLDMCAHSEQMYREHYQNPKVGRDFAEEYLFNFLPPAYEKAEQDEIMNSTSAWESIERKYNVKCEEIDEWHKDVGYYDCVIINGQVIEMSDHYPKDYKPHDPMGGVVYDDYLSDDKDKRRFNSLSPNDRELVAKIDQWRKRRLA
ncbi:MAG: hypothetical protein ACPGQC_10705 [Limisphaerales bacterium]